MTELDPKALEAALLPCPFCGGTDLYWPYGTDPAVVKCGGKGGCGAESGVGDEQTKEAAIAAWNRRAALEEAGNAEPAPTGQPKFKRGDRVRKIRGSSWQGVVVGDYSSSLTPEGYDVESEREPGSVQLYPAAALELVPAGDTREGE